MGRIEKEKKTIDYMIKLYCNKQHKEKKGTLCPQCEELLAYSQTRLTHCKFGDEKKFCSKCPIHCYKKDMKYKIKEVMRFSGPRLLFYQPVEVIKHLIEK
jgi:hypothetical protein